MQVAPRYKLLTLFSLFTLFTLVREGFTKKSFFLLDFVHITKSKNVSQRQITSPQFGQLVQLFLNAKNIDLNDIQNDSLSKILFR